ncbi:proteasome subunit beta [Candidatus Pacearchaeota archaeon]|nr:proteasome subunit beta [Candidatus Pacearchaeota archaeon]
MNIDMEEISKSIPKTGTSIVGITCKDGVVIASDRRVSIGNGQMVAQKDFKKVIKINDYMLMAVAGTASDAVLLSKVIAAELKLKELKTRSRPTVKEAAHLISISIYRNIRTPSMIPNIVATICGGFNEDGSAEVYSVSPAGDIRLINDYDASGSGMVFMLGLLERQYKSGITVKEGVNLAQECIKSSTQRDTASGNGIDVFSITKEGIKHEVSEEILPQYK